MICFDWLPAASTSQNCSGLGVISAPHFPSLTASTYVVDPTYVSSSLRRPHRPRPPSARHVHLSIPWPERFASYRSVQLLHFAPNPSERVLIPMQSAPPSAPPSSRHPSMTSLAGTGRCSSIASRVSSRTYVASPPTRGKGVKNDGIGERRRDALPRTVAAEGHPLRCADQT